MRRFTALLLVALLASTQSAFAQEAASSLPIDAAQASVPAADATLSADSAAADTVSIRAAAPAADAPLIADDFATGATSSDASTTPLQDTTNTQDTVDGNALQDASNPETLATTTVAVDATTTDATSTPVIVDATSTPEGIAVDATPALDVVAQDVQPSDAQPDVPPSDTPQPQDTPAPQPEPIEQAIPVIDLAPKPEYSFALTGKHVATKRIVRDSAGEHAIDNTQQITPTVDNTTGTMRISGACSNTYYVVLVFKNQDDYARDPLSYIVNRAFPCVASSFSYDIDSLPSSLANGTYYLLVGEEGDRGPWAPITQLTEITINRNH